ncbi:hypothetical protein INR49_026762 [Caranx melampygus]|nr:hypothetical protein INR49_026762 [Caranx melampygus]
MEAECSPQLYLQKLRGEGVCPRPRPSNVTSSLRDNHLPPVTDLQALHGGYSAVIEAGAETKFCASLLQPNETMVMTVTLMSEEKNTTLLKQTASEEFHTCTHFQAPEVQIQDVQKFEVEVRGDTFYSKEVRKVMVKVYKPATFVQTDKPIYLPGQTVHFRVITLDNKFRPASRLYSSIEIEDVNSNLIGQWQNKTSDSKILQLSYSLNSEAREGLTRSLCRLMTVKFVTASRWRYVLPKFDVKMETSEEVSIEQEQSRLKYTYGQPVPVQVEVEMCRPIEPYLVPLLVTTPEHPQGTLGDSAVLQGDKAGTEAALRNKVDVEVDHLTISPVQHVRTGKACHFYRPHVDFPEDRKKALRDNLRLRPQCKRKGQAREQWSNRLLSNLTTDKNVVASFSVSTESFRGDVQLRWLQDPHYETGRLTVSLAQASTVDTKSVSSLEVNEDGPLPCDKEEEIFIHYTVVGEKQGSVHVMYLVLSRGVIVMQGFKQIEVQDQPAVPGEETTMQLTTQPDSLCGVSAVDQSVLIKEPGKTLTAEKIFNLLSVTKASYIPYEVQDPVDCLHVRPRRYIMPHPSERDDAYTVFQNVGMKMATNLFIRIPSCLMFRGREYHHGHYGLRNRYSDYGAPGVARLVFAGEMGSAASPGGHLDPPIIETVTVSPASSVDYTLTPLSGDQYKSCLCANERKTLSWTMAPTALGVVNVTVSAEAVASDISCGNEVVSVPDRGRIDVVTRSLIVKAEGTEKTKTHNWLLCPKGGFGSDQTFGPMTDRCCQSEEWITVCI